MEKNIYKRINWKKGNGLVPAVVQDPSNGLILMLGFMNKEALSKTMKTGFVWFYSRTKNRLWMKGEESKNKLKVTDIRLDCDNDTLLIKASPSGPACHTGNMTCFSEIPHNDPVKSLYRTILDRKNNLPKKSYTTSLLKAGLDKITLKVAEESLEVIHASQKESKKRLVEETIDLLYHVFVLLVSKNISLEHIESEIRKRST